MNAAKEVVNNSLKMGDMAQILDAHDLEELLLREREIEQRRQVNYWQYRADEHIALLAQLIRQAAMLSKQPRN